MAASVATSGFGTLFKRGDGGVGAGTQASKTIGTSNQQLRVKARLAGVAGNSKTFGIVVAGLSTAYSQVIGSGSVLINSATDGAGAATTTVNEALYQLMQNTTFVDNFQGDRNSGNGTGVLVAGAAAALTGGADGAEVFTTVSEIKNITGPERGVSLIETTHMESPLAYREYLGSLLDAGEVNVDLNWNEVVSQTGLVTDLEARTRRNFQIVFVTAAATKTYSFAGIITKIGQSFAIEQAIAATVTVKITGPVTVS